MIYLAVPFSRDIDYCNKNYRLLVELLRKFFPCELFISTVDMFPFQADENHRTEIMDLATTLISSPEVTELWYGGLTYGVIEEKNIAETCHKEIHSLENVFTCLLLFCAEEEYTKINQLRGFL